jgi:ribosomal protein S18 acetylase RimI-like enzyme
MPNIIATDLADPAHCATLLALLDHYAHDPMGGRHGLSAYAHAHLVEALRACPTFHSWIAYENGEAVGLINCFLGFSTFAARPLLNVHDIVVRADRRGQGICGALLRAAETSARAFACCKLTLEVLENNAVARTAYRRFGFIAYELDPAAGHALFLEKKLD